MEIPSAPTSTKDQDALWALAPEGAETGFVASARGVRMLESGFLAARTLLTVPELTEINAQLEKELVKLTGSPNATLADLGLARDKGFAMFGSHGDAMMVVVPVGDRDKFLARVKGVKAANDTLNDTIGDASCKPIQSTYVCVHDIATFAKIGKAALSRKLAAFGSRGDLEFVGSGFAGPQGPSVAIIGELQRGTLVVRGIVNDAPSFVTSKLGAPAKVRVAAGATAGFGLVDVRALLADAASDRIAPNLTIGDLTQTIAGPATLAIAAGTTDLDIRIPLSDTAVATGLVEHCNEVRPLAMIGASASGGVCHIPIPRTPFGVDAWIEGKDLRIGKHGGAVTGTGAALSALGMELANGQWSVAFFGRGTLLGMTSVPGLPSVLPPEGYLALRAVAMMNEIGIGARVDGNAVKFVVGIRTAWANPDDVIEKLIAISPQQVIEGKSAVIAKSIADGSPQSPFAADLAAGIGGVIALVGPIGVIAAVAVPLFFDSMKQVKQPAAIVGLNRIGKAAKIHYIENAVLPAGDAPLTPAQPCCKAAGMRCQVDPKDWQQEIWKKLDFALTEPSFFQYGYHSDGKTFTAIAVGDLDCDGIAVTYTMTGTSDNGNITTSVVAPPPNSD